MQLYLKISFIAILMLFARNCIWRADLQAQILENYAVVELKKAAYNRDAQQVIAYFGYNDTLDKAVLASLASLEIDSLSGKIAPYLSSENIEIRQLAAFAMGQNIKDSASVVAFTPILLERLSRENDLKTKTYLLESLGKTGNEITLKQVANLSFESVKLKQAQALALAKFAERGVATPQSIAVACSLYKETKDDLHGINYAIYSLSRIHDRSLLKDVLPVLLEASVSQNIEVRLHALEALSKLAVPKAINAVLMGARDSSWQVRSWASRTLSKYISSSRGFKSIAIKTLVYNLDHAQHPLVIETSLRSLLRLHPIDTAYIDPIRKHLFSSSLRVQNTAMRALAELYPATAEDELLKQLSSPASHPAQLEAVGMLSISQQRINLNFMPWLLKHIQHPKHQLATAALNSWGQCWNVYRNTMAGSEYWTPTDTLFEGALLRALKKHSSKASPNPAAVKTITSVLSDEFLPKHKYLDVLNDALAHFSNANDINTILHLLESLGNLKTPESLKLIKEYIYYENKAVRKKASDVYFEVTGKSPPVPPTFIPPKKINMEPYRDIVENPVVELKTTKGSLLIELYLDKATFSTVNFIQLIESGFYDSLTFHRLEPNFVLQGGDPNGDGTGGPGYTICSEFNAQSFKRGVIGMAHAGKDTEGSQFFIMLSHHPFLDGKYTPFGKVIDGWDVLDQLEIGDRILRADVQIKRIEF